jgi:hypothetical protein
VSDGLAAALIVACTALVAANLVTLLELKKVQKQVAPIARVAGDLSRVTGRF